MDEDAATAAAAAAAHLTREQAAAAHAPLDTPLMISAAAGTGKTTTMLERVKFMVDQGVPPEEVLVLTFSRRAAGEFRQRLRARVPSAAGVSVETFHAWSWALVQRHWSEAGYERPPCIAASEEQLLGVMRDCIVWDRLALLAAGLRSCLFLPPSAGWPNIAEAAGERYAVLHALCLRAAVAAHNAEQQLGSGLALSPEAAAALPFEGLPPRLQMLLACELHAALTARLGGGDDEDDDGSGAPGEVLAAAERRAGAHLAWVESRKRQGRMPDGQAYAALCAAAATAGGAATDADCQALALARVGAAYQEELRRAALASLSCLPLLARQLLGAGGGAAAWARERWTAVVVDEFQDTGGVLLDLLGLLRPRHLTVVGDDDQSIYSFLTASPDIFGQFRQRFGAQTRCLQLNFRSTPAICAFGSTLLAANRRAERKQMVAARGADAGGTCRPVAVSQYASAAAEAEAVAGEAQRLWLLEGVPYAEQAALFRCLSLRGAAVHAPLVAALRKRGIPYHVANQDRLADDAGVAALAAFLSVVADPACDPGFAALLGLPIHGLGHGVHAAVASQRQAARLAGRQPPSLLESAEAVCSQAAAAEAAGGQGSSQARGQVPASQLAAIAASLNRDDLRELARLVQLLRRMQQCVAREPLPDVVLRLLRESGLLAALLQEQQEQQPLSPLPDGAANDGQAPAEPPLPPKLQCVLKKAQQLATQWEAQHAAQQGATGSSGSQAAAAEGSQEGSGGPGSQQGAALVRELLARLAMDSAADDGTPASSPAASQPAPRQPDDSCRWLDSSPQASQQDGPAARPSDPGSFTISTIHAAKGLEWDAVFVPFCNQGHLPVPWRPPPPWLGAAGPDARQVHMEEERRLFHVAATRARHRLFVSYVQAVLPGPGEGGAAQASQADAGMLPAAALEGDPSELPRCSAILSAAVRRLRRQQPGVLCCQGRLPHEQYPGLFDGELEEEEAAARRQQQGSQAPPLAGASQSNAGSGGGGGSQAARPSLAEQMRLRLAAQGGKVGKVAAKAGARRKAVLLRPAG